MNTETKTPSIPAVTPTNLAEFARAVKGVLDVREGRVGDKLDANVTFRDLVEAGLAMSATGVFAAAGTPVVPVGAAVPGAYSPSADMTIPPAPTSVTATGSFTNVMVEWVIPTYGNHAYAEVWASDTDVIGGAVLIGTSTMSMFVDAIGEPNATRYYWVRLVSAANVTGAFNATLGTQARTAADVTGAILSLTGPGNPFKVVEEATVLPDGSVVQPGIYAADAFFHNGQIVNAMIANLAVDNAKIINISAAKLTVGDGTIGGTLKSENYDPGFDGWAVFKNGNAEFSNATVRGTVYAGAGTIGGVELAVDHIRSTSYIQGEAGFRINSDGSMVLGSGMSMNAAGVVTFTGALYGATGTFSGALQAASGTFTGSLSAATGTFAGSLSAATGTFAGSLSAATGTFAGTLAANAINVVNTINIAENAVTIPVAASGVSGSVPYNSTVTVVSAVIDVPGDLPVFVSAQVPATAIANGSSGNQTQVTISLYRDGVLLVSVSDTASVVNNRNTVIVPGIFSKVDNPGGGAHTYSITIRRQSLGGGDTDATYASPSLFLLVAKR